MRHQPIAAVAAFISPTTNSCLPATTPNTTHCSHTPTAKQAWKGCGSHVPSVFAGVPEDKWCTCDPKVEIDGKEYPPQAKSAGMSGFFQNLVGGEKQ